MKPVAVCLICRAATKRILRGITFQVCVSLAVLSTAVAEVIVRTEQLNPAEPAWKFKTIPRPSKSDIAAGAKISLLENQFESAAADGTVLLNGVLPNDSLDLTGEALLSNANSNNGSLLIDLKGQAGSVVVGLLAPFPLGGAEADTRAASGANATPPNIIVILADDLGYGDPGTYGGWVPTPQLDRLCRGGLRFTDFHSNSSVCSPTRAALMTGRYQQRVGIVDVIASHLDTPGLNPDEFTMPRMMKQKGYATAVFGKWHLSSKPEQNPIYHGFDEFRGYLPGAMDYFIHEKTWYNGLKLEDQPGYTTHHITSNAVQYIERHRDRPFFLYVAHQAVHLPFQTPDDTPDNRQPIPKDQMWSRERIRPKYKVMLEEMDKGIGQILDTLERTGLSQRTLVFFFSDNGAISAGSNAPFRGGKFSLYEGGSRVPAIAYWPGHIKPNTQTDQLAAGMDLLPTFAEIIGAKIPGDRRLDGVSLRGVLLQGEKLPPRRIYFGYEPKLGTALRDEKFKAILKAGGRFELYDLSSDIGEKTDLAGAFPAWAAEMRKAIETWRDQFQSGSQ